GEIRDGTQLEDREGVRHRLSARRARARRRGDRMTRAPMQHRRSFLTLLGASAAAWPLAARGQQPGRMRQGGGLLSGAEDSATSQALVAVVREGLQKLGWVEGRNIRIDYRFAAAPDSISSAAEELVGLGPDVLIANGATALAALQRATRTIPIVFGNVADPVANGFVTSIPRPGGNITGFATTEQSISVKWLELLKEIAPRVTRAVLLHDPVNPNMSAYLREMERSAPAFGVQVLGVPVTRAEQSAPACGVQVSAARVTSAAEIEHAMSNIAREPNSGLVVASSPAIAVNRALVVTLAARHRLPAVYSLRYYVVEGGLAYYGTDGIE